jgi:putative ABC transport system permease protein
MPNVEAAALVLHTFGGGFQRVVVRSERGPYAVALNRSSVDYFQAAGISLLRGRLYSQAEVDTGAPVAVVSQKVARDLWGPDGLDRAVGSSLTLGRDSTSVAVIGVVNDIVGTALLLELSDPVGSVYRPLSLEFSSRAFLVVRARGDTRIVKREVEQLLPSIRSDRPPRAFRLESALDSEIALAQVPSRIATLVGVAVLILTVLGLQGLVALFVRQRLRDIAIRIVLGATPGHVTRHVVSLSLRPAIWGLAAGSVGAVLLTRALAGVLFGLNGLSPLAAVIASLVLAAAFGLGVSQPVIRALRVDPAEVLRST